MTYKLHSKLLNNEVNKIYENMILYIMLLISICLIKLWLYWFVIRYELPITNNNRYMNINIAQTIFQVSYENNFHVMCI